MKGATAKIVKYVFDYFFNMLHNLGWLVKFVCCTSLLCMNSDQEKGMSTAFLQMASIFNQLELSLIRSRVRSGVANAKAKGKQIGRKPTTKDDIPAIFYKHFPAFQAGHMNASEFARICGLSRTTVYKYLKLLE